MKKSLNHTKVTVKLRKAETRDEWYIYLEKYPIIKPGCLKPTREREYLNRTISTPVWDKSHNSRGGNYLPKRDNNGIIMCRSEADRESCIYAENVRALRQREFDNASLYTETEAQQAELNEKSQCNFIEYFESLIKSRHGNSSDSIIVNWKRVHELLKLFANSDTILFSQIDVSMLESLKQYLLTAPQGGKKSGTLSQNSASTYFSIIKAALKQAFVDGYLMIDIAAKVKSISGKESRREHLSVEELNRLIETPCERQVLKRAAIFSALTGIRHCDIQKMTWGEIRERNGKHFVDFTQEKTDGVEYMPISDQALQVCGARRENNQLVFEDLPDPSWISRPLKKWIKEAGISRHITFHCFRHTFATLQLTNGTDIYTVSKMLGHTNVKTTQIYAKIVDEKKDKAANAIQVNLNPIIEENKQE